MLALLGQLLCQSEDLKFCLCLGRSGWGGEKSCCELLEVIKTLTRVVILQLEGGDSVEG